MQKNYTFKFDVESHIWLYVMKHFDSSLPKLWWKIHQFVVKKIHTSKHDNNTAIIQAYTDNCF